VAAAKIRIAAFKKKQDLKAIESNEVVFQGLFYSSWYDQIFGFAPRTSASINCAA
jgi:hypothetical protein